MNHTLLLSLDTPIHPHSHCGHQETLLMLTTRRAGLVSCELNPRGAAELIVVFCHGFGAPGDDLVPLGLELQRGMTPTRPSVHFAFPQAPLSLDSAGWGDARAWWMIDMQKLQRSQQSGQLRDLRQERPVDLPAVRDQMIEYLTELQEELQVSWSQIVLGGFSQGAMLTLETVRHLPHRLGGAVLFSGTLINEAQWRLPCENLTGLPIVQSHGLNDVVLPYSLALELRILLEAQGAQVDFVEFEGGHAIPLAAMKATQQLIAKRLRSE